VALKTLSRIKLDHPHLPVVLITKNETENLMNEAIGRQISDYLIKPVNPNQVLLSLKKIMGQKRPGSCKYHGCVSTRIYQAIYAASGKS
jgi:DNA-binding NtrC family response regulator